MNRSLGAELMHRRAPQLVGLYLGASFALLEFTGMMIERFVLSEALLDLVLVGLISLLPTVLMLVWFHGAPGRESWTQVERIGIPLNLVVSAILLAFLVEGRDLEAAAQRVVTTDETGQAVTRSVPREEFVERVILFFPEAVPEAQPEPWQRHAFVLLLEERISQDPFVDAGTLFDGFGDGPLWRLARAGYPDGLGAPASLQRELADAYHYEHFFRAQLNEQDGLYTLRGEILATAADGERHDFEHSARSLFALADLVGDELKDALDTQQPGRLMEAQKSSSELLTQSDKALELYAQGMAARLLDNDLQGAVEAWRGAVEIDPSFALAHLALTDVYATVDDRQSALAQLKKLNPHSWKLDEATQLEIRALRYRLEGRNEEAASLYKTWAELHPRQTKPLNQLAYIQVELRQINQAIATLQKSLEIDPSQPKLVYMLAEFHEMNGEFDQAAQHYERYAEERPNEYLPHVGKGYLAIRESDFESARQHFQRGATIQTDMVTPLISMAELELRLGNLEQALLKLADAHYTAAAPRQHAAVFQHQMAYERLTGKPTAALEKLERAYTLRKLYQDPLRSLSDGKLNHIFIYVEAGRKEQALADLAQLRDELPETAHFLLDAARMWVHLAAEEPEKAVPFVERLRKVMVAQRISGLEWPLMMTDGLVDLQLGAFEEAIAHFEQAKELASRSRAALYAGRDFFEVNLFLAEALRRAGQLEQAERLVDDSLEVWPAHPMLNLERAQLASLRGDFQAARAALDKTLHIWREAESAYQPAREAMQLSADIDTALAERTVAQH